MLEEIGRLKFEFTDGGVLVLNITNKSGLIKTVHPLNDGKYDYLIGWNVYSVTRHIFAFYQVKFVYRINKDNSWNKVSQEKLIQLANRPMEQ